MNVKLLTALGLGSVVLGKVVVLPITPFVGLEIYEHVDGDGIPGDYGVDGEYTVTDVCCDLAASEIVCGVETTLSKYPMDKQIIDLTRLGWS